MLYREARLRVTELVTQLSRGELGTPVPTCPGWTVHDVLGHLTGVAEDAVEGRLSGPPDDAQTAAEVARYSGRSLAQVLDRWSGVAAGATTGQWSVGLDPELSARRSQVGTRLEQH